MLHSSSMNGNLAQLPAAFPESTPPKVGVEMEMPILDRRSKRPRPLFDVVHNQLPSEILARIDKEFLRCQIEMKSAPCETVGEAIAEIAECVEAISAVLRPYRAMLHWGSLIPDWEFDQRMMTDTARAWLNVELACSPKTGPCVMRV